MNLSICIITYNHGNYIKDCLDGVLKQKFNYNYEIIISDDCSSDDTVKLCKEYQLKFPGLITILTSNQNMGMASNWYKAIQACSGEYIAICEGDDYWISEIKLIKQYDYMSCHPKCNLTFHDVEITGSNKPYSFYFKSPNSEIINFKDVLLRHQIPTCSMMIRKSSILDKITKKFLHFPVCDLPLHLLLTNDGYAFHLRVKYAVYRVNNFSITNNKNKSSIRYFRLIKMYANLMVLFRFRYVYIFIFKIISLFFGYVKDIFFRFCIFFK